MLKKLDIYIIKKYLSTYFFSIGLLVIIIIFFDISEKIDDFLGDRAKDLTVKEIIFDYYFNFIPYFVSKFSALFIFISVIYFTSRMAYRTEIIAILSSGISFRRLLRPYLIVAFFLTLLNIYMNNFIIPPANKARLEFENTFIRVPYHNSDKNIHRQIEPGTFVYLESYNVSTNMGVKFSLEKINDGRLTYKLMSDYIKWDSVAKKWKIERYFIRKFESNKETLESGNSMDTTLKLSPADFSTRVDNIETMNFFELRDYINIEKAKGVDRIEFYLVEYYGRFAFPIATIILTLIGVSISSRKVRGGIGVHIVIGLSLTFVYILFMQISNTASTYSSFPPILGVWMPNIVFAFITIYLLKKAPK